MVTYTRVCCAVASNVINIWYFYQKFKGGNSNFFYSFTGKAPSAAESKPVPDASANSKKKDASEKAPEATSKPKAQKYGIAKTL